MYSSSTFAMRLAVEAALIPCLQNGAKNLTLFNETFASLQDNVAWRNGRYQQVLVRAKRPLPPRMLPLSSACPGEPVRAFPCIDQLFHRPIGGADSRDLMALVARNIGYLAIRSYKNGLRSRRHLDRMHNLHAD